MTCRCINTEVNEKEPTEFEEYDPYRADWTAPNSLHGSRYSLENARRHRQGYDTSTEDEDDISSSYIPDRQYIHQHQNEHLRTQRNRTNINQPNNNNGMIASYSDSDSDDNDRRAIHHPSSHSPIHRPDSRVTPLPYGSYGINNNNNNSMRPIRTREIEYDDDDNTSGIGGGTINRGYNPGYQRY